MYLSPILLYAVSTLFVGLNVNYNDQGLWNPYINMGPSSGSFSPFILSLTYTTISGLSSFLNACFLVSAYTAGNTALFVSSRTLFSLAQNYGNSTIRNTVGRTSHRHTPIVEILFC